MAFDSSRRRAVVFGGYGTEALGDTWEWDGNHWTRRTTAVQPRPRYGAAMVYDEARGRAVLFGGSVGGLFPMDDTWEWDGTTWQERFPSRRPPRRNLHAMVYDRARQRTLLFGGDDPWVGRLDDTWEWDGTIWNQRHPATVPPARLSHAMAYDAARERTVLFGGYSSLGWLYDTMEWDGTDWTSRQPANSPATRWSHALAYDEARGRVVLFGGSFNGDGGGGVFGDTWEYAPVSPAAFAPFGAGCASSGGTATLASDRGSLPWIGDAFTVRLSNLGATTSTGLAFWIIGESRTSWGTIPLPLDLSPIGMPGCSLYVDPVGTLALAAAGGQTTVTFHIPILSSYAGVPLYTQGGGIDPGANALGVTMTNACALVIGAR